MTSPDAAKTNDKGHRLVMRIMICATVLLVGIGGFIALAALKTPPAEIAGGERPIKVTVLEVNAESIPITIFGYGEVRALNSVQIAPEVAGRVIAIHPRLEQGEIIQEGALLFEIDPRDYAVALSQAQAENGQLRSVIQRLEQQFAIDQRRFTTLVRSRDLALAEFKRINDLFQRHAVGTQSGVDRAEQAYNAAVDQADQMAQAIALYPIRIKEAASRLAGAQARLEQARVNLERSRVVAPFTGRLTMAAVEEGQVVAPGAPLVTLADDSVLEIQVPLDSHDVRRWMRFKSGDNRVNWFEQPEAVICRIRWAEDKKGHVWQGQLHRMVAFDQKTRTVTVAIRIAADQAHSRNQGLPLVEGMFCAVEIPGKTLHGAMRVPRAAVSFKNTVYVAVGKRLKTVPVEVARIEGDQAFITGGLSSGDRVVVTRLVDPLENALLEILPDMDASEQGGEAEGAFRP